MPPVWIARIRKLHSSRAAVRGGCRSHKKKRYIPPPAAHRQIVLPSGEHQHHKNAHSLPAVHRQIVLPPGGHQHHARPTPAQASAIKQGSPKFVPGTKTLITSKPPDLRYSGDNKYDRTYLHIVPRFLFFIIFIFLFFFSQSQN